jgi:hypothetical protein
MLRWKFIIIVIVNDKNKKNISWNSLAAEQTSNIEMALKWQNKENVFTVILSFELAEKIY